MSSFHDLKLPTPILEMLQEVGYKTPTPIQIQTIPFLLEGRDVLGQAQTGTGKTAAFALPLLARVHLAQKKPQVLVLAPTRELAIQVAEAFKQFSLKIQGLSVLPIYGGQDYSGQLRALRRGVHIVVGTPGRIMDHMVRKTLDLSQLNCLVLDEADEMLRMGFIEDIEWILERTKEGRQVALFSATMPQEIKRIADRYLTNPEKVIVKADTSKVPTISQRYWVVQVSQKFDALTRILEAEETGGVILFVRTKAVTAEVAEKLERHGYAAAALNGDIAQKQREATISQLKSGEFDILVATDVAARGLDVDRITHVINYDMPHDSESYVHRIGRTGRAGRHGNAILFVTPREVRMLNTIERTTKQKIQEFQMPSTEAINKIRISRFKQKIVDTISTKNLSFFTKLIEEFKVEFKYSDLEIAASLAKLLQGDTPLLLSKSTPPAAVNVQREREQRKPRYGTEVGMATYRLEVGHRHGVRPGNIVGAITNEVGLDSKSIGSIDIYNEHTIIDLPVDMPTKSLAILENIRVSGQKLQASLASSSADHESRKSLHRRKYNQRDNLNKKLRRTF